MVGSPNVSHIHKGLNKIPKINTQNEMRKKNETEKCTKQFFPQCKL